MKFSQEHYDHGACINHLWSLLRPQKLKFYGHTWQLQEIFGDLAMNLKVNVIAVKTLFPALLNVRRHA